MHSILLVEDSLEYAHMVQKTLGPKFLVSVAENLSAARALLAHKNFELILLDVVLPDGTGFDFCSEVRGSMAGSSPPVIFLSGRGEVQDRVLGWSLGADDYITKPFSPVEFQARVQNRIDKHLLQRDSRNVLRWSDVAMNLAFHEATVAGESGEQKLDLTPIEFKLLYCFVKNADRVLSRTQLIDQAWGTAVHVTERTVDKHVSILRQKLQSSQVVIKTVSGLGYRLVRGAQL